MTAEKQVPSSFQERKLFLFQGAWEYIFVYPAMLQVYGSGRDDSRRARIGVMNGCFRWQVPVMEGCIAGESGPMPLLHMGGGFIGRPGGISGAPNMQSALPSVRTPLMGFAIKKEEVLFLLLETAGLICPVSGAKISSAIARPAYYGHLQLSP